MPSVSAPLGGAGGVRREQGPPRTTFSVRHEPHSYQAFRLE
jgi:hypothetical protein